MAAAMNIQVMPGKRANSYVFHCGDGFYYHFNKSNYANEFQSSLLYLRCKNSYTRRCAGAARIETSPNGNDIEWLNLKNHTCPPNPTHHLVQHMRQEILRESVNEFGPYETPAEVVRRIQMRYPPNVACQVSSNSLRSSIRRERMNIYPAVPGSLYHLSEVLAEHVHLTRCLDGIDNIYAGSVLGQNGTCSVVFISRRMRRYMRRCRVVFVDGTFNSRPIAPESAQVLQIVGVVGHSAIPLAQMLLNGKTQAEYLTALNYLRQLVPHFRPTLAITDYEMGLQNALRQAFNCHVSGCYWHFCRAVSRAAKHDLGLHQLMQGNRLIRSIVRCTLAVPLLPTNLMIRGFRTILVEAHRAGVLDPLVHFFNYYIDTWMSPAAIRSLSVYGIKHRTNNICESSNRRLRSLTGVHRPTIWHFLNALRRYDSGARLTLRRVNMGLPISRVRKTSAINNDGRIRNLTINLMSGHISLNRFLHLASTRVMQVFDNFA